MCLIHRAIFAKLITSQIIRKKKKKEKGKKERNTKGY